MSILLRLHILILLTMIAALAMLIPAVYASSIDEDAIARNFFYSALLCLTFSGMVGLATAANPKRQQARNMLLTCVAAVALLPAILAFPFAESLPDTGLFNAWWEMVSSLTTTGASLYSADLLPAPLHLWRALVGWMGGLFMLVAAVAILAPLRVGGFEIMSSPYGRNEQFERLPESADPRQPVSHLSSPAFQTELTDPAYRLIRAGRDVFPIYAGLTLALWLLLLLLGDDSLVALCRALGTLSTSGITPTLGPAGEDSGVLGEMAVFLFLIPALSRRFWPGGGELRATERMIRDPELRFAAGVVILVALVLFARHYFASIDVSADNPETPLLLADIQMGLSALWGGLFSALSYLTTTGWSSVDWQGARAWSGLSSPGLIFAGLAIMGGGVATTAGGVKLLRIYALARHGEREMERIIHPSSVAGGGRMARRLRREGAYLAFIFFMLFAISIAVTVILVSIQQIEFETATILSIAALTNTGPLASAIPLTPAFEGTAGVASAPWEGWSGLSVMTKSVLAGAMVVGRLEILAILALFTPDFWRR
ncbi:trk system potassium uptake protein TrkH [Paracoccus saliphilus]|uniref:Trk system potassium uptake protein TrkH n=2 Tax=Paracoccus saliphilus TaxID=405559 RepID=A0AA45W6X7_9RHOB|nr:potassium transporter TrkG [Paracoccus saliphilus]WCR03778.1 TrkH family potassium uptake protein [Paracoccus saliphilus]SIT04585.1 trk system potassium uptake protein TrkH [Paracoccus saliphilus]